MADHHGNKPQTPGKRLRSTLGSSGLPAFRPARSPLVSMGPSLDEASRKRAQRKAAVMGLAVAALILLTLVWLVRSHNDPAPVPVAAPVVTGHILAGPPHPTTLARADDVTLQLPIARARVVAIGYFAIGDSRGLNLTPVGRQANVSFFSRVLRKFFDTDTASRLHYFLIDAERSTNAVSVGAAVGTDVYATISGTVVAISENTIDDTAQGSIVEIQPLGDAQTVVTMSDIDVDDDLAVGKTVSAGVTLIGYVRSMSQVHEQPMSPYTHGPADDVQIQVERVTPTSDFA
jgi:hypothetical protein